MTVYRTTGPELPNPSGPWPDQEIVHPIQPYQARKSYVCPGCETVIEAGTGHVVVVPVDVPDLRRHWHRGCWHKERRRRGEFAG